MSTNDADPDAGTRLAQGDPKLLDTEVGVLDVESRVPAAMGG